MKTMKLLAMFVLSMVVYLNFNHLHAQNNIKPVTIGEQVWMTENLNVNHFRNGDAIPEVITAEEWLKAGTEGTPAWCYYDNNAKNGEKFGKLYNWFAVNDTRGLAPEGWHIPSVAELDQLVETINYDGNALKALGEGNAEGAGTNTSGFSALLAGARNSDNGGFNSLGTYTFFWSTTENPDEEYGPDMIFVRPLSSSDLRLTTIGIQKQSGASVRCIKD